MGGEGFELLREIARCGLFSGSRGRGRRWGGARKFRADLFANSLEHVIIGERFFVAAEGSHGSIVEIGQQFSFPVVPGSRANGGDVGGGQDKQHAQAFLAAYVAHELQNESAIGEIAAEGEVRHQEVLVDEEDQEFALMTCNSESIRGLFGDAFADLAVIFGETLAEVM